jgi:hypothetical protein
MTGRRLAVVTALAGLVLGCSLGGGARRISGAYPGVCADLQYSARHCLAVVTRAIEEAGIDRSTVGEIDITWFDDGAARLGGNGRTTVELHTSGGIVEHEIFCGGISGAFDPSCGDDAKITLRAGIDSDVACSGEAPAGCQTMPPTPPPKDVAAAHELRVASLDVPIDHEGHYEINVGKATLADGYLQELGMQFADMQPQTYWIDRGSLEVRSDIPGRPPIGSRYRDPYAGLEPVTVYLVFDVTLFTGLGVLQVRDIVVR